MKLNRLPDWLNSPNPGNARASVSQQTNQALESIRRESGDREPHAPEEISRVSRQTGVRTREIKPGLVETSVENNSYT